ncbi:hypothetical protein B0H21DRAFT_776417 [Amylocystis lapponica]|nr:hypothetical protein B0H21DRAFT_776417 [Amylocystis lapponica]
MVYIYRDSNDFPAYVWDTLRHDPRSSNIILGPAEKARTRPASVASSRREDLWIVCATRRSGGASPSLEFILSCIQGPLGSYPIFIYTPFSSRQIRTESHRSRITSLVNALQKNVAPERVFSVFALEPITRMFAAIWRERTGVPLDGEPEYYAAKFSYCTRRTFCARQPTTFPDMTYTLRPAVESDIRQAASLCYGFAAASEPFTLTPERAVQEATLLIRNRQLWVHEVQVPGQPAEIASIVAVTRTSDTVAAITKVYTNPRWRQRGCAERLTRHVCEHLLKTKESVVLYVAHDNPAAATVYHRVGFVGLAPGSAPVDGVDSWLELGFERSAVTLGHW